MPTDDAKFFYKISKKHYLLDDFFSDSDDETKFSRVYRRLFRRPSDETAQKNLASWWDVFSQYFELPSWVKLDSGTISDIIDLFEKLEIPVNPRIVDFLGYLVKIYPDLIEEPYRDDCVFGFCHRIKFSKIRVAVIGQDPSPIMLSNGCAFDEVVCKSTKNLINGLNEKLQHLDYLHESNTPTMLSNPPARLDEVLESCSLDGLMQQGVLFMNTFLQLRKPSATIWLPITAFIVTQISKQRSRVAFLLMGQEAGVNFAPIIEPEKHFVCRIYHPLIYNDDNEMFNWKANLPFLRVNWFFYLCKKITIDWKSMDEFVTDDLDLERRDGKWQELLYTMDHATNGYYRSLRPNI